MIVIFAILISAVYSIIGYFVTDACTSTLDWNDTERCIFWLFWPIIIPIAIGLIIAVILAAIVLLILILISVLCDLFNKNKRN